MTVMSELPSIEIELVEDPEEVHKIYKQSFIDEQVSKQSFIDEHISSKIYKLVY